jgi:hypothetical protein
MTEQESWASKRQPEYLPEYLFSLPIGLLFKVTSSEYEGSRHTRERKKEEKGNRGGKSMEGRNAPVHTGLEKYKCSK